MITEDQVRGVPLFAAVDDAQVRRIAARAADIRLGAGDWAAREGEAGAFYVLLEGRLEITKVVAGRQQQLAFREAGGYFGEVPLLLGAPFLASFRAVEPAHLLRLANYSARVTLLVRGASLAASMSQYLIDQLATRDNIAVRTNAEMVGVSGRNHLEAIDILDRVQGATTRYDADEVFIFIGADANTGWLPDAVARDTRGYVLTGVDIPAAARDAALGRDPYLLETSVPGIFAASDVRHDSMKRVASAVGEGSMAIAFIHQYLAGRGTGKRVVSALQ